jgi:hypothetical protein
MLGNHRTGLGLGKQSICLRVATERPERVRQAAKAANLIPTIRSVIAGRAGVPQGRIECLFLADKATRIPRNDLEQAKPARSPAC